MRKLVLITLLALGLTGCHTIVSPTRLRSLVGQDVQAALDRYGPPAKTYKLDHREYFEWYDEYDIQYSNMPSSMRAACTWQVVAEDGIIRSVNYFGNEC